MSTPVPSGQSHLIDTRRVGGWTRSLLDFESLVGAGQWRRRTQQLIDGYVRSPYQAKIVEDYHWIEIELASQLDTFRRHGLLAKDEISVRAATALDFASSVVRIHRMQNDRGKRILLGRLRDGLNSGFAGLFFEVDIAAQVMEGGNEVRFPDFDGTGSHDLDVVYDHLATAIECKSISADAGRKVHRRDFYRFMDLVRSSGNRLPLTPRPVAVVVTMTNRFPAARPRQDEIARHVSKLFEASPGTRRAGEGFTAHTEPIDAAERAAERPNTWAATLRARWGENAHIASVSGSRTSNLVIVRSVREDDTSREALAARREAVRQLPAGQPAIIALQYEDITVQDLYKVPFRRRLAILDAAIFHDDRAAHIVGIYHCAFNGRWPHAGRLGKPAITTWRTERHVALAPPPLGVSLDDAQFALLLGAASNRR